MVTIVAGVGLALVLGGCMSDSTEKRSFDKSPVSWYDAIKKSISHGELEKADKEYLSLRSEHTNSSLIPTAMLALGFAHMDKGEYLLADFYFEEYLKRGGPLREYASFMRLKASFLGIGDIDKDQKLILKTLDMAKSFYSSHPSGRYAPLAKTIIVRLEMAQYLLNEDIAELYERVDKPKAAKIYREKNSHLIYKKEQIQKGSGSILSSINPF